MNISNIGVIAPRIYNFFPKLVGPINKWDSHLIRMKDMGFNWIYINPLNYTGFSGSLYSIKDFYKFNPIFANKEAEDPHSWDDLKGFVKKCHAMDIKFMYDLVINHSSIDSPLIEQYPDWFTEKWAIIHNNANNPVAFFPIEEKPILNDSEFPSDRFHVEKRIASPYAIDPADARKITIWGDLAEINNKESSDLNGLTKYWLDLVTFYLEMGFDGFRCDAAYQVPPDMWRSLIDHSKSINPDIIFMAETLGCTLDQMTETVEAGFHYINNSSKWWDYTAPWCIKQHEEFRKYVPSVGFPETHDTERIASDSGGREDVQKFKYFFASFFSAGVLMPIGYEYGFKRKIDVVKMTPEDWEEPIFDISGFIQKVNRFKTTIKCLNEDGEIEQIVYRDSNILILKKTSIDEKQSILMAYNKDWNNKHYIKIDSLKEYLDLSRTIHNINIDLDKIENTSDNFEKELEPNEYILFLQE